MKKVLLTTPAIALVAILAHQFLPWYAILVSALIVAYFLDPGGWAGWWSGFLAGMFVWGGYALWLNLGNEGILAERVGALFGGLPGGALVLVSALLGALAGGSGALTGALARHLAFH